MTFTKDQINRMFEKVLAKISLPRIAQIIYPGVAIDEQATDDALNALRELRDRLCTAFAGKEIPDNMLPVAVERLGLEFSLIGGDEPRMELSYIITTSYF